MSYTSSKSGPCACCGIVCGCRIIYPTATVSFAGVSMIGCVECPSGDGTSQYFSATGSLGTYTLNQFIGDPLGAANACCFHGTFSGVTATVEGSGPSGGDCPGDGACITTNFTITVCRGSADGGLTYQWELEVVMDGCEVFLFISDPVEDADCPSPVVFSATTDILYFDCTFNAVNSIYTTGGTATVTF